MFKYEGFTVFDVGTDLLVFAYPTRGPYVHQGANYLLHVAARNGFRRTTRAWNLDRDCALASRHDDHRNRRRHTGFVVAPNCLVRSVRAAVLVIGLTNRVDRYRLAP